MEKKYLIHQADNLSPRPLQSLGVYKSLDANILVAGSADRNLRFLEVDTFEEIAKYEVDKKSVNCVTISGISINGDDPFIITAGKDKAMQIWSPTSGNLGKDIELPTIEVLTLATYQGSASLVLIGTKDCKVLLWNITTNSLVHSFQGHRAGVYTVSITSTISFGDIQNDNDLQNLIIVSGSVDHTARTWNYNDGQKLQKFRHKRSVYSLVVTEKTPQPLLVTAGAEYLIRLWDIKSGFLLRTFEGHIARINSLCLWEDYQTLVLSASGDHTIRIHDLITGECICILQGHTGDVLTVLCTETDVNVLPSSTITTSTSSSLSPRNVIVTSSEDLSLIQWDLQQIISDFYYTSGENCGVRNDNKPYLPLLQYIPPIETDIGNLKGLSKDEKRKLKKDMKRQKIHRMSVKYRRARSSMSQSSSIGGMDTSDMNNLEDDDDEPFIFENLIDNDDDDDDNEIKNVTKTKKRGNSVDAFEQDLNEEAEAESYFMKIMNGENNEDDDEENNNKNTNSNTNTNKKKNSIKNSNNINNKDVISQISNEQQKINEIIPGNEVIVAVTDSTSKSRRSSWNQVLPFNSNNIDENRNENHNNELFDITSKIRKASLTMVNSMMSIIGGNGSKSRHNSITKVGIDPNSTPTIIDPSIGLLNQKKDDINPRSRSSSEAATNNNSNNNNSEHKHVNHNHNHNHIDSNISSNVTPTLSRESQISQTNNHNNNNTTNNNSITPPRTPKSPATYSSNINDSNNSSRPSVLQLSESNIKSRVQNTLTDYHVAQADDQLEADRRRQEASEKLAKRLKNKKNGGNDDNNATTEEKEFNSIKEKKLLQHKLQANRARKSLMISKERAAEVLQKRLDELNQKKLSNKESNKDKIGEDNGSDED